MLLLLLKGVLGHENDVFKKISFFKHKNRWRIETRHHTFEESSQKWKFLIKVHYFIKSMVVLNSVEFFIIFINYMWNVKNL